MPHPRDAGSGDRGCFGGDPSDEFPRGGTGTGTGQSFEFAEVGTAPGHVLKAGLIGGLVRNALNGGGGVEFLDDDPREVHDRDLLVVADVDDFAVRLGAAPQTQQGIDGIGDMAEAPGLATVAEDAEGLSGACGGDEPGQHHSPTAGLAGADDVEETGDDDGDALFTAVGEGEEFVEQLAARVAPAAEAGGADEEIVLLGEPGLVAFSVNLRGGGEDDGSACRGGGVEDRLGFAQVGFDGAAGGSDDEFDAHSGGEVEDDLGAGDLGLEGAVAGHGGLGEGEVGMVLDGPEVFEGAG